MKRHARGILVRLVVTALAVLGVGMVPITTAGTANAAPGDVGYVDFKYGSGMGGDFIDPDLSPTAHKPQSKLWYAQDRWWGVLELPGSSTTTTIHSYNETTHTWTDTGVVVDNRSNPTHADVLWAGGEGRLYVATAGRNNTATGIQVKRYRYDSGTGKYVNDPGLPTGSLNNGGVEAAVIAKDSSDRIWVAYTASALTGRVVRVFVSNPQQTDFGPVFTPPVNGTDVTNDDIATLVSHDQKISLVWSNQNADVDGNTAIYAAQHPDGAPPTEQWEASRKIFSGPNAGDDHISLSSVEGSNQGSVYAVVKSAADDAGSIDTNSGLVRLLVLRPSGTWETYVHSRVRDDMTRPVVLLQPGANKIHVLATAPVTGGVVYKKTTAMDDIAFEIGLGDPFIELADHDFVNNVTSTKQHVTAASGLLGLASDQRTGHYVHNYLPFQVPKASFTFTPQTGPAPLEVTFDNTTTGSVDSWEWSFGDGTPTSSAKNPTHTFEEQGSYTVTLKATNAAGSHTATAEVKVGPPAPVASFDYELERDFAPATVTFTDTSTPDPGTVPSTTWAWDFGDGGKSTEQNPTHTYDDLEGGTYTVKLTVKNASDEDTVQETITVGPNPDVSVVELDRPRGTFARSRTIDVAWHAATNADVVASYDVQVRQARPARRSRWRSSVHNGLDAATTSLQLTGRRGSTYCFRVRSTNIADETGPWSAMECTAVPLDDRDINARGRWREASGNAYYEGTALVTRARGASASRTVTGKQVALLVTRRPNGGKVLVFRGKRLVKRVSLGARTVKHQRFVTVSSTKRVKTARYRVVVKSRGKPVTIDGIAVSRR